MQINTDVKYKYIHINIHLKKFLQIFTNIWHLLYVCPLQPIFT